MNYDELSFVNQQLAGMLKSGVPLEGALRELSATMQRGALRDELAALEADLAKGTPLGDALAKRKLPDFYVRMVQVGAKSGDLPGVLLLLADYYSRMNSVWTRLKGLMVYPFIVLVLGTLIAAFLAHTFGVLLESFLRDYDSLIGYGRGTMNPDVLRVAVWVPAGFFGICTLALVACLTSNALRSRLRSFLPGFREANLAQLAAAMNLMLQSGTTLKDALDLAIHAEGRSALGVELGRWRQSLAAGRTKFADVAAGARAVPPLFIWLVASAGENLTQGFARAAELYYARAVHRIEMMLYAALPASVILLGVIIVMQAWPFHQVFLQLIRIMDTIGDG